MRRPKETNALRIVSGTKMTREGTFVKLAKPNMFSSDDIGMVVRTASGDNIFVGQVR